MVHRDFPENVEPLVIPCPRASEPSASFLPGHLPFKSQIEDGALSQRSRPGARLDPRQLTKLNPSTMLTEVTPSVTGSQVSLSQKSAGGVIATTKIITLPRSAQFPGAVHTALPPRFPDDKFQVSVDMDRRRHYSLVEGPDPARAAVIERHRAFVSTSSLRTPRASALDPGAGVGRSATAGVNLGQEWKGCYGYPRNEKPHLLASGSREKPHRSLLDAADMPENGMAWSVVDQGLLHLHQDDSTADELESSQQPKISDVLKTVLQAPLAALSWLAF